MDKNRKAQFVICKASAGSGKTYTLVREYLRLAFDVPGDDWSRQFRRILAITFTNKAAKEMKDRVMMWLDKMATQGTATTMGAELAQILGWDNARLRLAAQSVHAAILHNYSDFAVSTIDSFMSRIVRTFARDLHLPMGFEVVTDDKVLRNVSTDTLIDLAGRQGEEELTEILWSYIGGKMEEGNTNFFSSGKTTFGTEHSVDGSISTLAKELFKEEVPGYMHKLEQLSMRDFYLLRKKYLDDNAALEQQVAELGQAVLQLCADNGLTVDSFFYGKTGVYAYFVRCAEKRLGMPSKRANDFFDGGKRVGAKVSAAEADAVDRIYPQMETLFRQLVDLLKAELPYYNTRNAVLKQIYPLALLNRISQLIEQQYGEEEMIHISEFNKQINKVVQDEPMPFVYERIGSRYQYYLIDEFQDTSRMQWQNLLPLVSNSIAQGGYSLVVGDAKQAIYRFRQGDVRQFVALPDVDNPVHGALLKHPGVSEVQRLEHNFRSTETVVKFNNDFYRWLAAERLADNRLLYDIFIGANAEEPDLRQLPRREGGLVSLDFMPVGNRQALPLEAMWQRVYEIIRQQVDEKGYRMRDITILGREGKVLSAVADYLSASTDGRTPIPMVSDTSFLLQNSRVVRLLRAALFWVADEYDKLSAVEVLEQMRRLGLLSRDYAAAVISQKSFNLEEILEGEGYTLSRAALRDRSLYECCESLVRDLRLYDVETDYTISFLGRVQEYCRRHRNHIGEFVAWFDDQSFSLTTSEDLDAVRLSTIHKAKGLEAPVIIYIVPPQKDKRHKMWVSLEPYQERLALPMAPVDVRKEDVDNGLLYADQLKEEEVRRVVDAADLLYVATTRARDKLFVLCNTRFDTSVEDYPGWLHQYVTREVSDEPLLTWTTEKVGDSERFVTGDDTAAPHPEESAASLLTVHPTLHFAPWEEKVVVASESKGPDDFSDDSPLQFGKAMHAILSQLTDDGDVAALVDHFCSQHAVPDSWPSRLREQIAGLLAHPDSARFFDHRYKVYNECDLLFEGRLLRPDRVLFLPDEVWIVDFKTGEPEVAYHAQVESYKRALAAMGHATVRGFLLYTTTATVEEV